MIPLIIGAALGAAKYADDLQRQKMENQTQGTIAAYSPWTGMQAKPAANPSLIGNVAQGAATGAALGQNSEAADAAKSAADKGAETAAGSAGALGNALTPSQPNLGLNLSSQPMSSNPEYAGIMGSNSEYADILSGKLPYAQPGQPQTAGQNYVYGQKRGI